MDVFGDWSGRKVVDGLNMSVYKEATNAKTKVRIHCALHAVYHNYRVAIRRS